MTNIELIKILQKSVDKFGQLPVDMNIINYVDSSNHYNLEDVVCHYKYVTLYNY